LRLGGHLLVRQPQQLERQRVTVTITVEPDMDSAANSGRSTNPNAG
jgi:hypothetical protein